MKTKRVCFSSLLWIFLFWLKLLSQKLRNAPFNSIDEQVSHKGLDEPIAWKVLACQLSHERRFLFLKCVCGCVCGPDYTHTSNNHDKDQFTEAGRGWNPSRGQLSTLCCWSMGYHENSYIREVAQTCPGYCNQCWKPAQQMKTHGRDWKFSYCGADVTNCTSNCALCWWITVPSWPSVLVIFHRAAAIHTQSGSWRFWIFLVLSRTLLSQHHQTLCTTQLHVD